MPPVPPLQHVDPETHPAVVRLRAAMPEAVEGTAAHRDQVTVRIPKEHWRAAAQFLRDDPDCRFELMLDLTAADYPARPQRFDVVAHLYSLSKGHLLRIKTGLAEGDSVDTLVTVWKTANWLERETFDMFGVDFAGHPDLRRMLLAEDWVGYPLRKDYPLAGY
ncbi:MAG TPA: NADH-quinone oxidoreductase subunit C [Chloroflexia bacterium]|nr:NADH-quinone oxidoreductase subunit C [Chloroflexia bacterium]